MSSSSHWRSFPRVFRLPLRESVAETPSIWTFRFDLEGQDLSYEPGQYVSLEISSGAEPSVLRHSFTLSSSPTEPGAIAVTTRKTGGPFKEALWSLTAGHRVAVRGPFGRFRLEPSRDAVMIAGGIGITPFRSMIRSAADTGIQSRIALLYSNGSLEEIAFRRELEEIARRSYGFRLLLTLTRFQPGGAAWTGRLGRIDASMIREAARGLDRPIFYVCGSPSFVASTLKIAGEEVRVAQEDLRSEDFPGY